jgi:hypothetical protein
MTLCMTIVAPWGVWKCSDHRVTYLKRRPNRQWQVDRRVDYSVKHVAVRCPDGAALITYAGLGRINDVDLSDWLRRQVRNESRTVDGMLIRVREAATQDLAGPAKANDIPHVFVAGAFLQRRPWWAAITNQLGPVSSPILDQFVTLAEPADNPPRRLVVGNGREAILAEDWALLDRIKNRRPKQPKDYSQVLANIHHRAKHSKHPARDWISETCTTTFMPPISGDPKQGTGLEGMTHWDQSAPSGKTLPASPFVLFGLDLTETSRVLQEAGQAMEAGQPLDPEELDRRFEEAQQRMFEPPTP